ncbi:MAG: protein kinase domain-containing protein [Longimicrobiales bacterium]
MSVVDWQVVSDVFADALEQPPETRSAFVAARCGHRPEVRAAVERLLEAESAAEPEFMKGLDPAARAAAIRAFESPPDHVGSFRLIREVGRGGMGQVFLADRADGQFEQRVAIKLLKRGMDSDAILARFFRERQILAALNHPNIARLVDGGIAEDGRPYVAMEHVEGKPITRYCDEHRLSIDERLALFCRVCLAVEYAHRNLIVHRDLKPSNILVTPDGEPKLLDFGIAKVLSPDRLDADTTTLTAAGTRMFTPEYAAPEQFRDHAITTSADVFSLGAVLYELLAAHRPFGARHNATRSERQLEEEAPRVTQALAAPSAAPPAGHAPPAVDVIAAERSTDPGRLRRQLAGDLETIVATALRPAPERRYASVEALRDDITRHQLQLPVRARPDTAGYRLSRFVRRNRLSLLGAAAVSTIVLGFGATALVQAGQIRRQARDLERERDRARSEALAAESVSDFLIGIFEVSDPMLQSGGDSILARQLLDRGAERIETDLEGQPALQARMLSVMGRAYDNLSHSDLAEPLLRRAIELQRATAGDSTPAVVATLRHLAQVQRTRGHRSGAAATLREAITRQERIDPHDPIIVSLLEQLATVLHERGDAEGVAATAADALERLGDTRPDRLAASAQPLRGLISLLSYSRDWEGLEHAHRKLVEVVRATDGPHSASMARAYASWAEARMRIRHGQREPWSTPRPASGADTLLSFAVAILHDLDISSIEDANALAQVAVITELAGWLSLADSLQRTAIDVYSQNLGEDHRTVAAARIVLAATLLKRGTPADAVPQLERAIAALQQEAESPGLLPAAEWRLAVALRDAGRVAESVSVFQSATRRFEAGFEPDFILTATVRHDHGKALIELGRASEAEPLLGRAIEVLANRWGEHNARADEVRIDLGRALTALGRYSDADQILAAVLGRLEEIRGPDDDLTQRARAALESLHAMRSAGKTNGGGEAA